MKRFSLDARMAIKIALAVAALGYLVYLVDPAAMARAAASAHPGWILAALLLVPLNLALQAVVWQGFVRLLQPSIRFRSAAASLLAGYSLGIVTPAQAGDLVGRACYLSDDDRWRTGALVFVHRLYEMAVSLSAGLVAVLYYLATASPDPLSVWQGFAVAGGVIVALLAGFCLFPRPAHWLLVRIVRRPAWRRRFDVLERLSTRAAVPLLAGCAAAYVVYTTQFFLLLRAFDVTLDAGTAYMGIALVYYVKYLLPPVTFLDLGIREGVAVYVFGALGAAEAAAFNAAFLIFCMNLALPALAGLPLLPRLRLHRTAPPDVAGTAPGTEPVSHTS